MYALIMFSEASMSGRSSEGGSCRHEQRLMPGLGQMQLVSAALMLADTIAYLCYAWPHSDRSDWNTKVPVGSPMAIPP